MSQRDELFKVGDKIKCNCGDCNYEGIVTHVIIPRWSSELAWYDISRVQVRHSNAVLVEKAKRIVKNDPAI